MRNGVYILRFPTGHFYIGSTGDFNRRRNKHIRDFLSGRQSQRMQVLFTNPEVLNWDWIDCVSREHAYVVEAQYIDRYIGDPFCCNTVNPKDPGRHQLGVPMDESIRNKIAEPKKGRRHSEAHAVAMKQATQESRGHKVEVDGVTYPSIREAGRDLGVTGPTVLSRARSSRSEFATWKLV